MEEIGDWLRQSLSPYSFFRLFESLTTHSTSSSRQFVQGVPLSTTSHLTFLARQQWQAFDARRLTDRPPPVSPAVDVFLFAWFWGIVAAVAMAILLRPKAVRSFGV